MRPEAPGPSDEKAVGVTSLAEIPAGSIAVLITDAASSGCALPLGSLRDKLSDRATVISITAYNTGVARRADFTIPAPAPLEAVEDIPNTPDASAPSWGLAAALFPKPGEILATDEILAGLAAKAGVPAPGSLQDLIRERARAIHKQQRGTIFAFSDGSETAVSAAATAEELQQKLEAGGIWVDEPGPKAIAASTSLPELRLSEPPREARYPLLMSPTGWRGAAANIPLPPLAVKLTRESRLRPVERQALIHPETAQSLGLSNNAAAVAETERGSVEVTVRLDASVPAGAVEVGVEKADDAVLDLCRSGNGGGWRSIAARISRT
jgi:anaerobic selenocysteine-containing dehydrogenase